MMAETLELAQVIADAREQAQVLRAAGHEGQARYVEQLLDRVKGASEDYLTWLSESDAIVKSGLAERTLRHRFRELLDCGLARYGDGRKREYRACAIPPRPDIAAARARGRQVA